MEVEWIILADAAEVVNNKLYMIGGGWETITVNAPFPQTHQCAVAVSFLVPWNETNQQQRISIVFADQAGHEFIRVDGQIEVGRPPGIALGRAQRIQMAITTPLPLQKLGSYVVIAWVEDRELKRFPFDVVAGNPALAMPARQSPSDLIVEIRESLGDDWEHAAPLGNVPEGAARVFCRCPRCIKPPSSRR